jgi:beta-glucosidase
VAYADTVTAKNGQFGLEESVEYREGIFVGYRYYEKENVKPAFAFGYGLSYTDFKLENLRVKSQSAEEVLLTLDVANVGGMAGAEVVQCYVSDCACSVERPLKELKAYSKVFLQPGEKREVSLSLPRSAFAFYSVEEREFVVEPGEFLLQVGNASDNCELQARVML